jgi:putative flippase GtrA
MNSFLDKLTETLGFHNPELTRFIRYNLVAGIATFVDLFIYWFLITALGVFYLASATIGFVIGLTINYSLNRVWGFKGTKRKLVSGFFYFALVGTSALIIALLFLALFVEVFGMHYFLARVFVVLIVIPWNYFLNALITFRQPRAKTAKISSV